MTKVNLIKEVVRLRQELCDRENGCFNADFLARKYTARKYNITMRELRLKMEAIK